MKKLISLLSLSLLLVTAGCQSAQSTGQNDDSYSVIASFYPLYFFTNEIVGDLEGVKVTNLIPSGGEPHSYEPSPSQLAQMESADLILVQGAGLEPWFEGLEHELEHDGVQILEVNAHLNLMAYEEDSHDDHEDEHDEHDDHDHGEFDPHTWLDPVHAVTIVEEITDQLIAMDGSNVATYIANAEALSSRLENLHTAFETQLESCELDAFITSHDAFNYLANRYHLHAHSVSGISPFDEPSAKQITELIAITEEEGMQHIFFEVLANAEAAKVLAEEAGLDSLVLNPIAGLASNQSNNDYFSIMQENLDNLKTGLACE